MFKSVLFKASKQVILGLGEGGGWEVDGGWGWGQKGRGRGIIVFCSS